MGLIGNLIKGYQKNKIENYIRENSVEQAFDNYGVEKLVKSGVLKAIPNSSYFYRRNVVYDRFGAVFNYYCHFANGNIIIYEDFVDCKDNTVERNYCVVDGCGVKRTKWHNNIIDSANYIVLTNTIHKIDKTNKAVVISPIGSITNSSHDVLCLPYINGDGDRVFQTKNINKKGNVVSGEIIIDEFCNEKKVVYRI